MRRTQKNIIFQTLSQTKFGIDSFDIEDDPSRVGSNETSISVVNTPFKFVVFPHPHDFNSYNMSYVTYGPAFPLVKLGNSFSDFNTIVDRIKSWLKIHVEPYFEDNKAPDLWEEYKNGVQYLKIDDLQTNDLTYFTPDDITRIRFAIEDLKTLIPEKFNITQAQIEMVNKKLDYLVDVAGRAPQTDWKGVVISVISSIIIALSLDTARGGQLWELFMQVFRAVSMLPGSTL